VIAKTAATQWEDGTGYGSIPILIPTNATAVMASMTTVVLEATPVNSEVTPFYPGE
jgi:hypothetical protein